MVIDPLSDRPAYQQVADSIRLQITSGEWPAGHKLPSEKELMTQCGVSRVTVRLAMAALRSEGLIQTKQGKGSCVREQPPPHRITARVVCSAADPGLAESSTAFANTDTRVMQSVSARMPTPQERRKFDLLLGVPLLVVTSRPLTGRQNDTDEGVVTAVFPGDRVVLDYIIALADQPHTATPSPSSP